MHPLLKEVEKAATGLYFLSESEYPLEVFHLQAGTASLEKGLLERTGQPQGTPVEKVEVDYFFRNHLRTDGVVPQQARRYSTLVELLKKNLSNLAVYRIGNTQVSAFICGKLPDGQYGGLRTILVET